MAFVDVKAHGASSVVHQIPLLISAGRLEEARRELSAAPFASDWLKRKILGTLSELDAIGKNRPTCPRYKILCTIAAKAIEELAIETLAMDNLRQIIPIDVHLTSLKRLSLFATYQCRLIHRSQIFLMNEPATAFTRDFLAASHLFISQGQVGPAITAVSRAWAPVIASWSKKERDNDALKEDTVVLIELLKASLLVNKHTPHLLLKPAESFLPPTSPASLSTLAVASYETLQELAFSLRMILVVDMKIIDMPVPMKKDHPPSLFFFEREKILTSGLTAPFSHFLVRAYKRYYIDTIMMHCDFFDRLNGLVQHFGYNYNTQYEGSILSRSVKAAPGEPQQRVIDFIVSCTPHFEDIEGLNKICSEIVETSKLIEERITILRKFHELLLVGKLRDLPILAKKIYNFERLIPLFDELLPRMEEREKLLLARMTPQDRGYLSELKFRIDQHREIQTLIEGIALIRSGFEEHAPYRHPEFISGPISGLTLPEIRCLSRYRKVLWPGGNEFAIEALLAPLPASIKGPSSKRVFHVGVDEDAEFVRVLERIPGLPRGEPKREPAAAAPKAVAERPKPAASASAAAVAAASAPPIDIVGKVRTSLLALAAEAQERVKSEEAQESAANAKHHLNHLFTCVERMRRLLPHRAERERHRLFAVVVNMVEETSLVIEQLLGALVSTHTPPESEFSSRYTHNLKTLLRATPEAFSRLTPAQKGVVFNANYAEIRARDIGYRLPAKTEAERILGDAYAWLLSDGSPEDLLNNTLDYLSNAVQLSDQLYRFLLRKAPAAARGSLDDDLADWKQTILFGYPGAGLTVTPRDAKILHSARGIRRLIESFQVGEFADSCAFQFDNILHHLLPRLAAECEWQCSLTGEDDTLHYANILALNWTIAEEAVDLYSNYLVAKDIPIPEDSRSPLQLAESLGVALPDHLMQYCRRPTRNLVRYPYSKYPSPSTVTARTLKIMRTPPAKRPSMALSEADAKAGFVPVKGEAAADLEKRTTHDTEYLLELLTLLLKT